MSLPNFDATLAGDARVTRMLHRWAATRRLSPLQAEAIRQQIISEPAPPDFDWWWRLLDPEQGQVFRSLPRALTWQSSAEPMLPGWPRPDDGEYQSYLRLT